MKKLLKKGFVAAACAVSMLAGFGSAHAEGYEYIDLFGPAALATNYIPATKTRSETNRALGINDAGTVVGYLKGKYEGVTSSQTRVMIWDLNSGGTVTDLGVMGSNIDIADVHGISENGQIAGAVQQRISYRARWRPFTYDTVTGTQTNLVTEITEPTAVAMDINDSGQTVGAVSPLVTTYMDRGTTAFISNPDGTISHIPGAYVGTENTSGAPGSAANAINNAGLVTGYTTVDGNYQAFLYDSATEFFSTLGTLGGGLTSVGTDVNELGVVVGYATRADGVERAFLAFGGTIVDLGALTSDGTSRAYGMNDKGDIVGTSDGHAFLYSNGQMVDLNDYVDPSEGITLVSAYGINNLGQIVGYGLAEYENGVIYERAFALTPTPVPASVLLFGSGIAGLALFRRRTQA